MVTYQRQVECRTAEVRLSETDVLPLCHATNQGKVLRQLILQADKYHAPLTSSCYITSRENWRQIQQLILTDVIEKVRNSARWSSNRTHKPSFEKRRKPMFQAESCATTVFLYSQIIHNTGLVITIYIHVSTITIQLDKTLLWHSLHILDLSKPSREDNYKEDCFEPERLTTTTTSLAVANRSCSASYNSPSSQICM